MSETYWDNETSSLNESELIQNCTLEDETAVHLQGYRNYYSNVELLGLNENIKM